MRRGPAARLVLLETAHNERGPRLHEADALHNGGSISLGGYRFGVPTWAVIGTWIGTVVVWALPLVTLGAAGVFGSCRVSSRSSALSSATHTGVFGSFGGGVGSGNGIPLCRRNQPRSSS